MKKKEPEFPEPVADEYSMEDLKIIFAIIRRCGSVSQLTIELAKLLATVRKESGRKRVQP